MTRADLTLKEVCQELGKSKRTITRYIKKGLLNPEKVKNEKGILEYRFDKLEVESFKTTGQETGQKQSEQIIGANCARLMKNSYWLSKMIKDSTQSELTLTNNMKIISLPCDLIQGTVLCITIPRPRKEKKLPIVLSREDVIRIFESVNNIKHKAILMLAYSAGLRVREVVKLRVQDIDTKRNMIHIKAAKGRKYRYTVKSYNLRLHLVTHKRSTSQNMPI